MKSLLKEGGQLAGLLFNRQFPHQGPPFGGDINEYQPLFTEFFKKVLIEDCENSIAPRMGSEVFIKVEK